MNPIHGKNKGFQRTKSFGEGGLRRGREAPSFSSLAFFFLFFFPLFLALISSPLRAQPSPSSSEVLERFRQQEERAHREKQEELFTRPPERSPEPELTPSLPQPFAPVAAPCFVIKRIEITGMKTLPVKRMQKKLAPVAGSCLTIEHMNDILKLITLSYVREGYITSRAYLPPQDLKSGILRVIVIEGILESLELLPQDPFGGPNFHTAFPHLKGRILSLRNLEQGLDQLNKLSSNRATLAIKAGSQAGMSIVEIKNPPVTKPWWLRWSADNQGSQTTGAFQKRLQIGFDNLLRLNESLSLSYTRSMPPPDFLSIDSPKQSHGFSSNLALPYGPSTLNLEVSGSWYKSIASGATKPLETSGSSNQVRLQLNHLLHRDHLSKTFIETSLTRKASENYIMGSRLETGSRILSVLDFGLLHSRNLAGGSLSTSLHFQQGLHLWGAADDRASSPVSPKNQFRRVVWHASYTRPFKVSRLSFTSKTSFSGQFSDDRLPGSEQMALGGYHSVRGIQDSALHGNIAWLLRHETTLQGFPRPGAVNPLPSLSPFFSLDVGHVVPQEKYDIKRGTIGGWSAGLRLNHQRMQFDMSYARLFTAPEDVKSPFGALSLQLTFPL